MIPKSLHRAGKEIPILVDSVDQRYLGWVAEFIPQLTNILDELVDDALAFLKDENLIDETRKPEFGAILFNGDDESGWWYSLMFAATEPIGVIFEGQRPTGTVHVAT